MARDVSARMSGIVRSAPAGAGNRASDFHSHRGAADRAGDAAAKAGRNGGAARIEIGIEDRSARGGLRHRPRHESGEAATAPPPRLRPTGREQRQIVRGKIYRDTILWRKAA